MKTKPAFTRYLGIDHGFSFPLRYFEVHHLEPDWPTFLDDFQRYWPTDGENTYVNFVHGLRGDAEARSGSARWRRLTEERAGAKSEGSLREFLNPSMLPGERAVARVEGWILGVM